VNKEKRVLDIERILVALDASPHSVSALQAALKLAEQLQADLCGLFIEDVNIRKLADLPFAQEIGLFSVTRRRLDIQELSSQLSAKAGEMRRFFEITTEQASVRCTYREARGKVEMEVLAAAADADVVILGKGAWSPVDIGEVGPAVRRVISDLGISALVLQAGASLQPPVLAVYDGSEIARKGLRVAAALSGRDNGHLTMLILADDAREGRKYQQRAEELFGDSPLQISYLLLTASSIAQLGDLVEQGRYGLVVMPAQSDEFDQEMVMGILDDVDIPVLLIKESAHS